MKKSIALTGCLVLFLIAARSQLCMTKTGFIGFYSKTVMEDIIAENNQVYAIVDLGKKNLAFSALLKGFIFRKELMQEHFNENYIESDKYPKSSFTGSYSGDVPLGTNGVYKINVKGNLTLHNITKPVEVPATLELKDGKLVGEALFKLKPEDFNIRIPSLVRDKIAGEIDVHVKIDCNTPK